MANEPNWYAPPAAPAPGTAAATAWQPEPSDTVTFWPRAFARLIDIGMRIGVGVVAGMFAAVLLQAGVPLPRIPVSVWASFGLGLVLTIVVHTVAESVGGATVGKLLMGMRVRSATGGFCSPGAAFKRAVAYIWDSFFFAIVAYSAMKASPYHQRVGDKWADTLVVHAASIPEGARGGSRALFGAAIGLGVELLYATLIVVVRGL